MLMAGEKYIALEETSQAIKEAVDGVKTDVAGVKTDVGNVDTNVDGVKTDTEGIVLSNASIKAIVDEIQNRIGVTADTGGSASAGSIMSKLNAIIAATASGGGITGAKYTLLSALDTTKTYTTENFAFILGKYDEGQGVSVDKNGVVYPYLIIAGGSTTDTYYCFGMCSAGGTIKAISDSRYDTTYVHIFEFTSSSAAPAMANSRMIPTKLETNMSNTSITKA